MKRVCNLWVILIVTLACNQQVYDAIYFALIKQAINSKTERKDLMIRYNSVTTLRELCNGQTSTWEQNNVAPGNYKRNDK